ncbi:MAG: metal-dependent hydrolase [Candidatus Nanosalina sp.]
MLGRQHFTLSIATGLIVLTPLFVNKNPLVLPALLGIAIGSLIPDIDASDATVFHTKVNGLHGMFSELTNTILGPLLPVFGYLTKYMVYKPSIFVLNLFSDEYVFEGGHRSFTHSITGVLVMTVFTGFLIWPPLHYFGIKALYLVFFLAGYMGGAFLHMLQDSFTRSGISWNQPFSDFRVSGSLRTGKDNRRPRIFLIVLLAAASVNTGNILASEASIFLLVQSFLIPCVCWTFFAWLAEVGFEK